MSKFKPLTLLASPESRLGNQRLVVTCTLKGDIVDDFSKMCEETGLTRSQLILQMIHHCMNRTDELKDLYRRLAILAEK